VIGISWSLVETGTISEVASGTYYDGSGTVYREEECLSEGCYYSQMNDSFFLMACAVGTEKELSLDTWMGLKSFLELNLAVSILTSFVLLAPRTVTTPH
jgi:hypothetical protein